MAIAPTPTFSATAARGVEAATHTKTTRRRVEPIFYLFLLPALILFTLAITLPALMGIFFSFTNFIGFGEWQFTGLTNYIAVASDPAILASYGFTLGFALATVILVNVVALALALGLSAKIRFKTGLRGIFVIPMVISGIVIAYVFNFLFNNSVPALFDAIGFTPLASSMLANPSLAWLPLVLVTAWQSVPGALLIYLAGLLSIPEEVYEAGSLDGASSWQRFSHITFPLVAGYVVINTVLGFKGYINAYDIIVGLTNGGPGTATRSVAMTIFTGFSGGDYAYQMANATIFFLVAVIISLLQLRVSRGKAFSL